MPDGWDHFSELLNTSSLIPDEYAAYRPLVAEGLQFFLENLPAERGAEILAEQLTLPVETDAIRRVIALIHHSPTLHKLAQVVARHEQLDIRLRRRLQEFESMEPRTPLAEIKPILHRELGDMERLGVQLEASPLAEASVAVVVPFAFTDSQNAYARVCDIFCGTGFQPVRLTGKMPVPQRRMRGVFKVLRPGIRERLESELDIWPRLGAFLDERCAQYGLPALDYADAFDSMRQLLVNEVHLEQEQRHLREAAGMYRDLAGVRVPRLLPFCTSRVTAMEQLEGRHVGSLRDMDPAVRRTLAERIVRAMLTTPVWSEDESSLFHADPHAGNLLATSAGELGIIDWSLSGRLTVTDRVNIVQIMLAAVGFDATRIARLLAEFSSLPPRESSLLEVARAGLRRIRRGVIPGLGWLIRLLDDAVAVAGVRPASNLMLFRKVVLTLEGVVHDVCPALSVDAVVNASALEQLAREWPARWLAPPTSRCFGTHLSNADLARALAGLPVAGARFWAQTWGDCLDRLRAAQ